MPSPTPPPDALLPPEAHTLVERQRALLGGLEAALEGVGTDEPTRRRLADLRRHLTDAFLLVVVGEFNAGKSSVLNALLGAEVMEEGPVPTTDRITLLRHGDRAEAHRRGEFLTERTVTAPLLRGLTLVDTPGTNSIVREHQALTEDFVPRADLLLFVTSFDRPLSESERQFLAFVHGDWRRRLAVVLNKRDLAASDADLRQVIEHVRDGFERLLGLAPRVFPVSARQARAARAPDGTRDAEAWAASGFADLEAFLTDTLTGPSRLALKLSAPLDAADRLLEDLSARLSDRQALLAADARALDGFRAALAEEEEALRGETVRHLQDVDAVLVELDRRGRDFLDDTIRVSGLGLLRDRDRFKEEFARRVLQGAEVQIEQAMGGAVDAVLRRVLGLWNRAYTFAAEQARRAPAAGPVDRTFLYDRERTFEEVRRAARQASERYDLREEARRLLENARSTAALFAGTQAAAAGLGTVVAVVVTATAFDITGGLIAAGALSAAGFWLLPRQRRRAQKAFRERVDQLRQDLHRELERRFAEEAEAALASVHAMVRPVSELVEREGSTQAELSAQRATLTEEAARLRAEVRERYGEPSVDAPPGA
jgi:GTP-binding protein EngB required for normal cell division